MTRFKSARALEQHLAASGSDVQVIKRSPARRDPARAARVALAGRRQAHPEHDEQVKLVRWVRANEDRHAALRTFHAVPNGGYRSKRTAALMKAEGQLAGVPDTFLPWPRVGPDGRVEHGLYIEMKANGGRLSSSQQEIIGLLAAAGYRVVVCYSAEEAVAEIARYLGIGENEYDRP